MNASQVATALRTRYKPHEWLVGSRYPAQRSSTVEIAPTQITVDTSQPRWSSTSETSAALDDAPKVALPDAS